ncbi:MAG: polysaccharide deacetylase family protein [Desulfovibrio sp.]|jgi:peptidoglycan/xylan/chitin deacetylase (PgdA/CDA1 family)|nr:polysaccharide deacetylase family protein [Desulfovibrio sp.]
MPMKRAGAKSLPAAMYHYVNCRAGAITVSPTRFEEHCRALAEHGIRGVGLREAEEFLLHGASLPEKSLLITFDDGFFDNYLYALPLLHKYGHRGAVFVVTERIAEDAARVSPEDLKAGRAPLFPEARLPVELGADGPIRRDVFLNSGELKAMDADGTLTPASHGRGHYGVFLGPEYNVPFLPLSLGRTFFYTDLDVVFGLPDFRVGPGLLHRAFVLNPAFVEAVKALVPQNFAAMRRFARSAAGLADLERLYGRFAGNMGRFETPAEGRARMRRELAGGKEDLEKMLGREVRSLCWPWGKYSDEAACLAKEVGFTVCFTTAEGPNPPGRPSAVHRFKAKDKGTFWVLSRVRIYSRPLAGRLYAACRI